MVFINNTYDVTLAPNTAGPIPALQSAMNNSTTKTFDQAMAANHIYQGNGLICQNKICQAMTGCDTVGGCPNHPDWKKVIDFCGPAGTAAKSMDGMYWTRVPADSEQKLLQATQQATGYTALPTPYNVSGMY